MHNFFSVFDLPVSFEVNVSDLEKRYFVVQRLCHPDRLVGKPPAERQQAILRSMQANEAFEALKSPLLRARHILALQGIYVGSEKDSVKPAPALLMEVMELREALAEATTPTALSAIKLTNERQVEQQMASLAYAFANSQWQEAAQHTIKLGYLTKITEEIRLKLKAAG